MTKRQLLAGLGGVVLALGLVMAQPGSAQDAKKAPDEPVAQKGAAEKAKKTLQLRLPAHFGKIVDEKQREQIYAIQKELGPKIQELKAQLQALTDERDKKIEAVLTPEQRKELAAIKEAAKAKRKNAAKDKAAAEDKEDKTVKEDKPATK